MAEAIITLPDGRRARISGPTREAVEEQARAFVNQQPAEAEPTTQERILERAQGLGPLDAAQREAAGVAENIGALVNAGLAEAVGGAVGFSRFVLDKARGKTDLEASGRATDTINRVSDTLTVFRPRTEAGQRQQRWLAAGAEFVVRGIDRAGQAVLEATLPVLGEQGAVTLATATATALQSVPELVGAKGLPAAVRKRAKVKEAGTAAREAAESEAARELGELTRLTDEAAKELPRGESLGRTAADLSELRKQAKSERDALLTDARRTTAGLKGEAVIQFVDRVNGKLEEGAFAVERMPLVRRTMRELDASIKAMDPNSSVGILELDRRVNALTQDISKAAPKSPEKRALILVRDELDTAIDQALKQDMVRGDPADILKWKEARDASARFKSKFGSQQSRSKAERIIAQFAEDMDMTPEAMSKTLRNMNSAGFKPEARAVVQKLDDIFGKDSVQMQAVRNEFLVDFFSDLVGPEPNLTKFADEIDKLFREQASTAEVLFSPQQRRDLKSMAGITRSLAARPKARSKGLPRVNDALATFIGSHGLAKAQLRKGVIREILDTATFSVRERLARRRAAREIVRSLLGHDETAVLITPEFTRATLGPGALEQGEPNQ